MNAAIMVGGLHREEYKEFFLKEAQGEMNHIAEFGQLILGLGGLPTSEVALFATNKGWNGRNREPLRKPEHFIEEAIIMERDVVRNYVQRMDQADNLESEGGDSKIHGRYIHIFLEDQMLDSRSTIDNLMQCLEI